MTGAVFNGNESRILSWSDDGAIRLWNLDPPDEIISGLRHKNLNKVITAPDESSILTWDTKGTLRLWDIGYDQDMTTDGLRDDIRKRTGARLSDSTALEFIGESESKADTEIE